MASFYKFLKKKILTPQEHLEIILDREYSVSEVLIILLKKVWRNIYNFIQRLFSKPSHRNIIKNIEISFSKKVNVNGDENIMHHCKRLRQDGITFFEKNEFDAKFEKIFTDLSSVNKLYSAYEDNTFYDKNKNHQFKMGYIPTEILVKNEEILKLINNKLVLNVLHKYFGTKVIFDNIWSWWSFRHKDNAIGPQNFHRDYNSINFLKLFVYLNDVDELSGPHVFVKTSHLSDVFNKIGRYKDEDVKNKFNNEQIVSIKGPKYTIFLANTFALHKGLPPREKNRLLLCILYSVKPSRASPKLPLFDASDFSVKNILYKNKYLNKMYFKF